MALAAPQASRRNKTGAKAPVNKKLFTRLKACADTRLRAHADTNLRKTTGEAGWREIGPRKIRMRELLTTLDPQSPE